MEWNELLSKKRLGKEIVIDDKDEREYFKRSEIAKDYRRIITSASFRRLQDKTQVFPLDRSDFVRTRLTHSYEVSALAKTLGEKLIVSLLTPFPKGKEPRCNDESEIRDIPDILACAGLLHDIGNPPFGHFGEEIIKNWFSTNLKEYLVKDEEENEIPLNAVLTDVHMEDLQHFDGNAQALRVLTKLHFQDGDYGMNLTSAVLNSLIKYPTASNEISKDKKIDIARKKMGYTSEDKLYFDEISGNTGAGNSRHPLAFMLEVADDIAYKTADIEDGFKKGLFTLDEFLKFAMKKIEEYTANSDSKTIGFAKKLFTKLDDLRNNGLADACEKNISSSELYAIQNWIPYAQEWFMYCAVYGFNKNYNAIMQGKYKDDLFKGTNHELSLKIMDDIMVEYIFPNRNIVKLELSANTILANLLDKFTRAVVYHDKKYKSDKYIEIKAYKKLYNLISDNYREAYKLSRDRFFVEEKNEGKQKEYDIYLRLLLVADYISGMTDTYAKTIYQELNGIY